MKEFASFLSQHTGFMILIIAIACILFGRIWSNMLNWGTITEPQSVIRSGKHYKVINLYLPKGWTEGWEVGSIICFESFDRRFFMKYRREIYVSGDRIRFANEEGPGMGLFYKASYSNRSTGSIVMNPVKTPSRVKK
jgi:hypothetical protein